jgi:hypothetical protein
MVPLLKLKNQKKRKKKRKVKGLLLNNINIPSLTKSGSLSPNLTFLRLNNVFQEQLHPYSTFGLTRVFLTLKIICLFFLKPHQKNREKCFLHSRLFMYLLFLKPHS